MAYLIVFLGGGLGAALRHGINIAAARFAGTGFPYGTLFINVSGSVLIGVVAQLSATRAFGMTPFLRVLLATGVLGGYTTFSTFSLDAMTLLEEGVLPALLYVGSSVVLGFLGATVGVVLARLAAR